jgi:excisionase family DNA binding protein
MRDKTFERSVELPLLLTVEEVASRLRVKRSWVYSHADAIGAFRLGKYLRFSWETVLERLRQGVDGGCVGPPPQLPKINPINDNTSADQGTNREQKN